MKPLRLFRLFLIAVVAVVLLLVGLLACWQPGLDVRDGSHDRRTNGLWMQHGWLGDDSWFERNKRNRDQFRNPEKLAELAGLLSERGITDVYPHLCPSDRSGKIAGYDDKQVERFLDAFSGYRVFPWVGGVNGASALVDQAAWRMEFVKSCRELLESHPRLAGIHLNIEPLPSGNPDFISLLDELRKAVPEGKLISVAAYPPPIGWQGLVGLHSWDRQYAGAVAARADQVAVMMYDTSLHISPVYQQTLRDWTPQVLDWYKPAEVLLGLPAYRDGDGGQHDNGTETLKNALLGMHAGLGATPPANYRGVCIYCEWQITPADWELYREHYQSSLP